MAQLILYIDHGHEYVTICTDDFDDEEFQAEYGGRPIVRVEILGNVTPFPTDRGLSES